MLNMATELSVMNHTCHWSSRERQTQTGETKEYGFPHTKYTKHPPPLAWRYQCQSTQCTITIKWAIYGTCDPWSIFTTAEGMTALTLQGKEICAYILSQQSPGILSCAMPLWYVC